MKVKTKTRRVVDMQALYTSIGRNLKQAREKAGVSQRDVGMALGMSRANVANMEAGTMRILLEHVYNAALLFNVPLRRLLP